MVNSLLCVNANPDDSIMLSHSCLLLVISAIWHIILVVDFEESEEFQKLEVQQS